MLKILRQLLCKHKYIDKLKLRKFRNISGETVVTICENARK